MYAAKKLKRAT